MESLHPAKGKLDVPDIVPTFEDRTFNGDFTFEGLGVKSAKELFDEKIKKTPEEYDSPYRFMKKDNNAITATFRGKNGLTDLEIYYTLPLQKMPGYNAGKLNTVHLREGRFLFDRKWNELKRDELYRMVRYSPSDTVSPEPAVNNTRFSVQPGQYHYAVEFINKAKTIFCSKRDSLTVPDYTGSSLLMSDIVIGNLSKIPRKGYERFGNPDFVPAIDDSVSRTGEVQVYFELYNLLLNRDGKSRVEVTAQIEPENGEGIVEKISGLIRRKNKQSNRVAATFVVSGESAQENIQFGIDAAALKAGKYILTCRAKDMLSGLQVSRQQHIIIPE